jgi:hypothetical protein
MSHRAAVIASTPGPCEAGVTEDALVSEFKDAKKGGPSEVWRIVARVSGCALAGLRKRVTLWGGLPSDRPACGARAV